MTVIIVAKPSVLIDGTVFESSGRLGIWRLFFEIISRTNRDINSTLLLSQKATQPIPEGIDVCRFQRAPELVSRRHVLWRSMRGLYQSRLRSRFPEHIWHPTFYSLDPRGTVASSKVRRLVTVYDMLSEDFYWMGDFVLQRHVKRNCLAECHHVVAISAETARSLERFFPELSGRITVVPLASNHTVDLQRINASSCPDVDLELGGRPFCLFVGGRNLYKHFEFVIRALSAKSWPAEFVLVVVGAPFEQAEIDFIRSCNVRHRVIHAGPASDQSLRWFYQRSSSFVFPSLGEGFGLPVLESQQNGTIPILSDIPVFREVGGAGALYYPPHDIDAFIRAVGIAVDPLKRPKLLAAASANSQTFTWETAAARMVDCYATAHCSSFRRSTS